MDICGLSKKLYILYSVSYVIALGPPNKSVEKITFHNIKSVAKFYDVTHRKISKSVVNLLL